jgi:hypothetical protein
MHRIAATGFGALDSLQHDAPSQRKASSELTPCRLSSLCNCVTVRELA